MALSAFSNIKKLFGGSASSDSERDELYKEALLLVLARAADSDTSVRAVEVEIVRKIVQRETGDDVSDADVRVAAASELVEETGIEPIRSVLAGEPRQIRNPSQF